MQDTSRKRSQHAISWLLLAQSWNNIIHSKSVSENFVFGPESFFNIARSSFKLTPHGLYFHNVPCHKYASKLLPRITVVTEATFYVILFHMVKVI